MSFTQERSIVINIEAKSKVQITININTTDESSEDFNSNETVVPDAESTLEAIPADDPLQTYYKNLIKSGVELFKMGLKQNDKKGIDLFKLGLQQNDKKHKIFKMVFQ